MIWAFTAKIDQTVTVIGRLEPSGSVRSVDSPSAGVVSGFLLLMVISLKRVRLYLMLKQKDLQVGVKL